MGCLQLNLSTSTPSSSSDFYKGLSEGLAQTAGVPPAWLWINVKKSVHTKACGSYGHRLLSSKNSTNSTNFTKVTFTYEVGSVLVVRSVK